MSHPKHEVWAAQRELLQAWSDWCTKRQCYMDSQETHPVAYAAIESIDQQEKDLEDFLRRAKTYGRQ